MNNCKFETSSRENTIIFKVLNIILKKIMKINLFFFAVKDRIQNKNYALKKKALFFLHCTRHFFPSFGTV